MVDSCNYIYDILHYIVSDEGPINDNDMQRKEGSIHGNIQGVTHVMCLG